MNEIEIPERMLREMVDALRLAANVMDSRKRITACDRKVEYAERLGLWVLTGRNGNPPGVIPKRIVDHKSNSITFESVIKDHLEFTSTTFPKGTSRGALLHLEREIKEIVSDMDSGADIKLRAIEFADALGCLIDAANRNGVTPDILLDAFDGKLQVNKNRVWQYNGDGSYTHIKYIKDGQ